MALVAAAQRCATSGLGGRGEGLDGELYGLFLEFPFFLRWTCASGLEFRVRGLAFSNLEFRV